MNNISSTPCDDALGVKESAAPVITPPKQVMRVTTVPAPVGTDVFRSFKWHLDISESPNKVKFEYPDRLGDEVRSRLADLNWPLPGIRGPAYVFDKPQTLVVQGEQRPMVLKAAGRPYGILLHQPSSQGKT